MLINGPGCDVLSFIFLDFDLYKDEDYMRQKKSQVAITADKKC
jgi:hypothetical protein